MKAEGGSSQCGLGVRRPEVGLSSASDRKAWEPLSLLVAVSPLPCWCWTRSESLNLHPVSLG